MSPAAITALVIAICLIPLAGLFGAMEAALQRVSKARVEEMRREGIKHAAGLEIVVADRARHVALLLLLRIVCESLATVLITRRSLQESAALVGKLRSAVLTRA